MTEQICLSLIACGIIFDKLCEADDTMCHDAGWEPSQQHEHSDNNMPSKRRFTAKFAALNSPLAEVDLNNVGSWS